MLMHGSAELLSSDAVDMQKLDSANRVNTVLSDRFESSSIVDARKIGSYRRQLT